MTGQIMWKPLSGIELWVSSKNSDVRHVADLLGEFGETLSAGEIVICGSIVPPIPVAPRDAVSYALDRVGRITIRFGPLSVM